MPTHGRFLFFSLIYNLIFFFYLFSFILILTFFFLFSLIASFHVLNYLSTIFSNCLFYLLLLHIYHASSSNIFKLWATMEFILYYYYYYSMFWIYILLVYLLGVIRVSHIINDDQNLICMTSVNEIYHRLVHDAYFSRYPQIE